MISAHSITATVALPTPIVLSINDATVTLDEAWVPYARAELTAKIPDAATYAALDPRGVPPRIVLVLTRTMSAPSTRTLNLVLRERTTDHAAGTMTLVLSGDEALLMDRADVRTTPDDDTFTFHQDSVKAIVDLLLADVSAPSANGGQDAGYVIFTSATNLIKNPSVETNIDWWGAINTTPSMTGRGGPNGIAAGGYSFALTTNGSPQCFVELADGSPLAFGMVAGRTYTISGTAHIETALTEAGVATQARRIVITTASTSGGYAEHYSEALYNSRTDPITGNPISGSHRLSLTFTLPVDCTGAGIRLYNGHTSGTIWWDAICLVESPPKVGGFVGPTDASYFDGNTVDATGTYAYAWTGTPNNSPSTRTVLDPRSVGLLIREPGVSSWDFVEPIVAAVGLRLYCTEARSWRLEKPRATVPGLVTIAAAVSLTAATETISRITDEWFDSVVVKYSYTDDTGLSRVSYDAAGYPGSRTRLIEFDRPYPGPGLAATLLAAAIGKGRTATPEAISDYTATPGMAVALTLPGTPPQAGFVSAVTWKFPQGEMTLSARGLTDS